MKKFESQEYRKDLASKLRQARSGDGKEAGREILNRERESVLYKASELIHQLKKGLPKEYAAYANGFLQPENQESLERSFEIRDISSELTLEHRVYIEAELIEDFYYHYLRGKDYWPGDVMKGEFKRIRSLLFPDNPEISASDQHWGIRSGPDMFDHLTGGSLLDNHNLNHVVGGEKAGTTRFLIQPFSMDSLISGATNIESEGEFYMSAGYNVYARQISKPLIILNPKDPVARKFIEDFDPGRDITSPDAQDMSLQKNERGDVGYGGPGGYLYPYDHGMYRLLFLANYPAIEPHGLGIVLRFRAGYENETDEQKYKWSDIATTIVNLRVGRLYERKQTPADIDRAQGDIQRYRDLLRSQYGIDLEVDKHRTIYEY